VIGNWKIKVHYKPAYRNFVGSLPCSIPNCFDKACGHHEQLEGQGTMGGKCCDSRMLPLCHKHHRQRHDDGRTFWWWQKLEPEELIYETQKAWLKKHKKFW
jgi:hypothetical protein